MYQQSQTWFNAHSNDFRFAFSYNNPFIKSLTSEDKWSGKVNLNPSCIWNGVLPVVNSNISTQSDQTSTD